MTEDRNPQSKLDRLADALIEETLAMSDDEILADVDEGAEDEGGLRNEVNSAIAAHRRQRLVAAKKAVLAHKAAPKARHRAGGDLRAAINKALAARANNDASLTLAARDGRDVPHADLEGLAEDLSELGFDVDGEEESDAS